MNKCLKIALIDFSIKRRNLAVALLLCFCTMFLLVISSIQSGFYCITNSYKTDRRDLRIVRVTSTSGKDGDYDKLSTFHHIESAFQKINVRLTDNFSAELSDCVLSCYPTIEGINRRYTIEGIELKKFYDSNSEKLYYTESDYPEHLICGRMFSADDTRKAILDENICEIFGLSADDILGENLRLSFNDGTGIEVEIVGVMASEYSNLYLDYSKMSESQKKSAQSKIFYSPFWLSDDAVIEIADLQKDSEWWYEDFKLFVDNTDNVTKVCDTITEQFGFQTQNMIYEIEKIQKSVYGVSLIGIFFISIVFFITLVFITNAIMMKFDRQKKFAEMLLKIGYKPGDIIQIYLWESAFLTVISEIVAIGFSFVISIAIDNIMKTEYNKMSDIESLAFLPSFNSVTVIAFIELALVLSVSFLTALGQIRRCNKAA